MRKAFVYFGLQMKRVLKAVPVVFATALILMGCIFMLFIMVNTINNTQDKNAPLRIGIVGDTDEQYFQIGLSAMRHLDSSRFSVSLEELTEDEALSLVSKGEISGYAIIPEGFVDSIMTGENKKIRIITTNSSKELMSALLKEFVDEISEYLIQTQNSVYGMQDYLIKQDVTDNMNGRVLDYNVYYVNLVLKRDNLFEPIEIVKSDTNLSTNAGYICGFSVFLIFLFGITCSPLFTKTDLALSQVLRVRGVKVWIQVLVEYIAYFIMMLVSILIIEGIAVYAISASGLEVLEWSQGYIEDYEYFIIAFIPIVACVAALQYMMFQIMDNYISGVLLQFIVAILLSYLSGCLYPISFFPEIIRKTAVFQPAGLCYRYLADAMLVNDSSSHFMYLLLYMLMFLVASVAILSRRLSRER